jgi:GTP-binding protein
LLEFIAPRLASGTVRLLVLLTKADKLSRREAAQSLATAEALLGARATAEADVGVALFSALSRTGVTDAATHLREWVEAAAPVS